MSPTPKAQRLRERLSINPDELAVPVRPASVPAPAQPPSATPAPPVETEQQPDLSEPVPQPPRRTSVQTGGRRSTPEHVSAVDDPRITPGRKDYRSFYIEDATFARFRAAIYWLARREDAAGEVPENMSAAVETWMQDTTTELEERYNDGETFRMPPVSKRRRGTTRNI
ncbi:MAG: hypothetical protein L0I76_37085 [Pseudonocardia sp.]|nr:hypothetical protein [Pseudonocardia sp.]